MEYIEDITLANDIKIILKTIRNVFRRVDVVREGTASDMDFGDWLLLRGVISKKEYEEKIMEAKNILLK